MQWSLYERTELLSIGRVISAILIFSAGLALLAQAYFVDLLPPPDGFIAIRAEVLHMEQVGTFQEPIFYILLEYHLALHPAGIEIVRSGQGISFEQYFELSVRDELDIYYDPQDKTEWRMLPRNDELSQYGLGFLMVIFGILSLSFPALVNWASRRDDFEFNDDLDDELAGVNTN